MNTEEFKEGAKAFHDGLDWFENPHDIMSETDYWDEWADGYEAAEEAKHND